MVRLLSSSNFLCDYYFYLLYLLLRYTEPLGMICTFILFFYFNPSQNVNGELCSAWKILFLLLVFLQLLEVSYGIEFFQYEFQLHFLNAWNIKGECFSKVVFESLGETGPVKIILVEKDNSVEWDIYIYFCTERKISFSKDMKSCNKNKLVLKF